MAVSDQGKLLFMFAMDAQKQTLEQCNGLASKSLQTLNFFTQQDVKGPVSVFCISRGEVNRES